MRPTPSSIHAEDRQHCHGLTPCLPPSCSGGLLGTLFMDDSTIGVASVVTPSCEQRALALGLTFAPSSAAGMLPVVCWHGATPPLCLVTSVRSSPGIPSHVCIRTCLHPRPRSPRRRGGPLRPLCCDQRYAGVAAPRIAPCPLPLAPRRDGPAVHRGGAPRQHRGICSCLACAGPDPASMGGAPRRLPGGGSHRQEYRW